MIRRRKIRNAGYDDADSKYKCVTKICVVQTPYGRHQHSIIIFVFSDFVNRIIQTNHSRIYLNLIRRAKAFISMQLKSFYAKVQTTPALPAKS